ncbi:hypothetical protein K488DRAFT_68637 [Vararia minispora EC-137]|uniref:Uncharacterized protein n=1 Tax=Vararia minispora EC-137 TaxID=1314806 RepID=A0ACB8QTW1_9AGAM|nr:hypothetical protein K488DRAFT_68637 [Vararia minispora EC-137]
MATGPSPMLLRRLMTSVQSLDYRLSFFEEDMPVAVVLQQMGAKNIPDGAAATFRAAYQSAHTSLEHEAYMQQNILLLSSLSDRYDRRTEKSRSWAGGGKDHCRTDVPCVLVRRTRANGRSGPWASMRDAARDLSVEAETQKIQDAEQCERADETSNFQTGPASSKRLSRVEPRDSVRRAALNDQ